MQHVSTDEVIRRALRARICPTCQHRPVGSESMESHQARQCEGACTIFTNLEALKAIAAQCEGDVRARFENAIRDRICQQCTATPTAGDFCYEGFTRICPLSLHAGTVLSVIEPLLPKPADKPVGQAAG